MSHPESVTLSGSSDAVNAIVSELQDQKRVVRKLETGGRAYHSHMMREIGQLYEDLLKPILSHHHEKSKAEIVASHSIPAEEVKMYSSVGHSPDSLVVMDSYRMSAAYWRRNLEQPVQFSAALASLAGDAKGIHLIEVGPHSALKGPCQQIRKAIGLDEKSLSYSPTLVRKEDGSLCIKSLAGTLFTQGHTLKWENVNDIDSSSKQRKIRTLPDLTRYPWDYSGGLLWSEPRPSTEMR